jgi:hypothetical protein
MKRYLPSLANGEIQNESERSQVVDYSAFFNGKPVNLPHNHLNILDRQRVPLTWLRKRPTGYPLDGHLSILL